MNNNYISDDLIKNFDITDQLITNNPNNQDNIIMNYINLIINNSAYNKSYTKINTNGNNINIYNNYRSDRLVSDTTIKNERFNENFLDYYSI